MALEWYTLQRCRSSYPSAQTLELSETLKQRHRAVCLRWFNISGAGLSGGKNDSMTLDRDYS